jgi:hypothetical protein
VHFSDDYLLLAAHVTLVDARQAALPLTDVVFQARLRYKLSGSPRIQSL